MDYSKKQSYSSITYTVNNRVIIDTLLNDLHKIQLDFIDEALEKSNLKEANEVIQYIKAKL